MPPKRKPETDTKEAASPSKKTALEKPVVATPKQVYQDDVLGRQCLVLFEVEDSESRVPFSGIVTSFEASLYLEQIVSEEEPVRPKPSRHTKGKKPKAKKGKVPAEARKPRRMKYRAKFNTDSWKKSVERLHLVIFEDGEELWLDLAELQAEGSLWWQDSEKDKAEDSGTTTNKVIPLPGLSPPVTGTAGGMPPTSMAGGGVAMPGVGVGMMSPQQMAVVQQQWNNQMRMMAAMGTTPASTPANTTTAAASAKASTPGEVLAAFASHHVWAGGTPGTTAAAAPSTETKKKRGGRPKGSKNKPKDKPTETPAKEAAAALGGPATTEGATPTTETAETATADAATTPKETPAKKRKPRPIPEGPPPSSGIPWVDDFWTFLETVPHGRRCHVASRQNASKIVGHVKKLAKGEGIGTKAWPASFYKDLVVDMNTDMKLLKKHAEEFKEKYGDPSNGWLLQHPMDKLVLYQEYKNDPEAFNKKVQEAAEEKSKKSATASSSTKKKSSKASAKKSPKGDGGDEHGPRVDDADVEKILQQAATEPEFTPAQQQTAAQQHTNPQSAHAASTLQAINAALAANQATLRSPPQGNVEFTDQFLVSPHRNYAQAQGHQPQMHGNHYYGIQQFPGGRGYSFH